MQKVAKKSEPISRLKKNEDVDMEEPEEETKVVQKGKSGKLAAKSKHSTKTHF